MAKIVLNSDIISLHLMQDGNVAEVITSDNIDLKEGTIIQRYGDDIILIGEPYGKGFASLIRCSEKGVSDIKVKVLSKGTLIQL